MPAKTSPVLVWFRNDLRLQDNPALQHAVSMGCPLILLYILENDVEGARPMGGASAWWLDKSLRSLARDIEDRGGELCLRQGHPRSVLEDILQTCDLKGVYWNRRYDEAGTRVDRGIKSWLSEQDIEAKSFNGHLLAEPWTVKTNSGGHYRVFTPFWKSLRADFRAGPPGPAPEALDCTALSSDDLQAWGLHPSDPDWSDGLKDTWTPGEAGAQGRLDHFLSNVLSGYGDRRNLPGVESTSGLSPHLRFGEISPVEIWRRTIHALEQEPDLENDGWKFLSELAWRDFSYNLLYFFPSLDTKNYNDSFDHFPWRSDPQSLRRWEQGRTGYPIVDAGMRELWHTGWMHNRVRMIVASFLTKHLLLDWRDGEAWFWDTLVDADPANNPASWQWTAGSGADAAPYFRIFNPITQGEKFDPDGDYVRKWVPEIAALPDKHLHQPWTASSSVLETSGITLGKTYPKPIVDHATARKRALDAYETVKQQKETA